MYYGVIPAPSQQVVRQQCAACRCEAFDLPLTPTLMKQLSGKALCDRHLRAAWVLLHTVASPTLDADSPTKA